MANRRKSYEDENDNDDRCPRCGCRHFASATAYRRGERIVVERICRNCGGKV